MAQIQQTNKEIPSSTFRIRFAISNLLINHSVFLAAAQASSSENRWSGSPRAGAPSAPRTATHCWPFRDQLQRDSENCLRAEAFTVLAQATSRQRMKQNPCLLIPDPLYVPLLLALAKWTGTPPWTRKSQETSTCKSSTWKAWALQWVSAGLRSGLCPHPLSALGSLCPSPSLSVNHIHSPQSCCENSIILDLVLWYTIKTKKIPFPSVYFKQGEKNPLENLKEAETIRVCFRNKPHKISV